MTIVTRPPCFGQFPYDSPLVQAVHDCATCPHLPDCVMADRHKAFTPKAAEERQDILTEARDIIYGDREQAYGDPGVNLRRIADLWTTYLRNRAVDLDAPLSAEDVCWMMVLLKIARNQNQVKRDNLVDAVGYVALIERMGGPCNAE